MVVGQPDAQLRNRLGLRFDLAGYGPARSLQSIAVHHQSVSAEAQSGIKTAVVE